MDHKKNLEMPTNMNETPIWTADEENIKVLFATIDIYLTILTQNFRGHFITEIKKL